MVDFAPAGLPLPRTLLSVQPQLVEDWVAADALAGNRATVRWRNDSPHRGFATPSGIEFDGGTSESVAQRSINAFFFVSAMHDFFYSLGFDEAAGNFQDRNPPGLGYSGDGLDVVLYPAAIAGSAVMRAVPDGQRAEMWLGTYPASARHSALDPDVVCHEFTHGVTERIVGGPLDWYSLSRPQSVALSEGWSDYFALTFRNYGRQVEDLAFGAWLAGRPEGLRDYRGYPVYSFSDLGKGAFATAAGAGMYWCSLLLHLNRDLGTCFGDAESGHRVGWQAVFDGLKLLGHANPNLVEARDATLRALDDLVAAGFVPAPLANFVRQTAMAVFARFGLGPSARSNGTSLKGNRAG